MSLPATFGEAGRAFFHRVSFFYPTYIPVDCDKKFDHALKKAHTSGHELGAFINPCKYAGVYRPTVLPFQRKNTYTKIHNHHSIPTSISKSVVFEPPPEPTPVRFSLPKRKPEAPKKQLPLYIYELEEKLTCLSRPLAKLTFSQRVHI
jgi:hypothetical protein